MPVWMAGLVAVAAITVTYFSCVRPHLRQRGGCVGGQSGADVDHRIAELQEQLRVLRAREAGETPPPPIVT